MKDKYLPFEENAIRAMKECIDNGDTEVAHGNADDLLCNLLVELGYKKVIDVYNEVDKWYA